VLPGSYFSSFLPTNFPEDPQYEKGITIPKSLMSVLPLKKGAELPKWNYTISPS